MCDTYGIELTEEHIEEFRKIADSDGEVGAYTPLVQTLVQIDGFVSPSSAA